MTLTVINLCGEKQRGKYALAFYLCRCSTENEKRQARQAHWIVYFAHYLFRNGIRCTTKWHFFRSSSCFDAEMQSKQNILSNSKSKENLFLFIPTDVSLHFTNDFLSCSWIDFNVHEEDEKKAAAATKLLVSLFSSRTFKWANRCAVFKWSFIEA